jgi:hypothetical protein
MGYDNGTIRIPVRVSRHNSEDDARDDAAVEALKHDI